MAADGYLPAWLKAGDGPPRAAIGFQWLLAVVMLWTASYQGLLTFIGFTLSLSNAATVAGLIRLRRREGPSLAVVGWPWVPVAFVVAVLGMAGLSVSRAPMASLAGFGMLGLGWVSWKMSRAVRAGRALSGDPG
jgi:APA family basic amino acid/polyamine antiporter